MKSVELSAAPRTALRGRAVKHLRATGKIPAVIYGKSAASTSLEISAKALETLLAHSATENLLVDLTIEGDARAKRLAFLQEIQHHPLSRDVLHVDLHEVAEDEKVTITVAVEATGEALGVKVSGGVLEHVLFKIKLRGLPKDIPEVLTIDVSNLDVGNTIHISDIVPPPGIEVIGDPKWVVMAVSEAKAEEVAAPVVAAEGAAAEPEVLKEKKPDAAAAPAAEKKK